MQEEPIAAHNAQRAILLSSTIISVALVITAAIFAYSPVVLPAQLNVALQKGSTEKITPIINPSGGCGVQ